jgi:hypothetical protein
VEKTVAGMGPWHNSVAVLDLVKSFIESLRTIGAFHLIVSLPI